MTKTHKTTEVLDKYFSKDTWTVHPSTIPFLTNIMVNYENHLHPYVAPVHHNYLNETKVLNITHTMLGIFSTVTRTRNCTWKIWIMILV
jgi:hypothetical protein